MKNKLEKNKCELLDYICAKVSSVDTEEMGLIEGKAGIALFLHSYYKIRQLPNIEKRVHTLINELWDGVHTSKNISSFFCSGHPGIAWAFLWFIKEDVIDYNDDMKVYFTYLNSFFSEQRFNIPVQLDLKSGIFVQGLYFSLFHNLNLDNSELEEIKLNEYLIYLIEECERIVLKRTSIDNLYLPTLSLGLLNSIVYFLLYAHKCNIYPHKTNILLDYCFNHSFSQIENSEYEDIEIFRQLLTLSNDENIFNSFDLDQIKKTCTIECEIIKETTNTLVTLGFYSLIYSNKFIPKNAFNRLFKENNSLTMPYIDRLSLNSMIYLGHALINVS